MNWYSVDVLFVCPEVTCNVFVVVQVFSYGLQPYYGHTNQEVVDMAAIQLKLPCPVNCPAQIYALMLECWNVIPSCRPSFNAIHRRMRYIAEMTTSLDFAAAAAATDTSLNSSVNTTATRPLYPFNYHGAVVPSLQSTPVVPHFFDSSMPALPYCQKNGIASIASGDVLTAAQSGAPYYIFNETDLPLLAAGQPNACNKPAAALVSSRNSASTNYGAEPNQKKSSSRTSNNSSLSSASASGCRTQCTLPIHNSLKLCSMIGNANNGCGVDVKQTDVINGVMVSHPATGIQARTSRL